MISIFDNQNSPAGPPPNPRMRPKEKVPVQVQLLTRNKPVSKENRVGRRKMHREECGIRVRKRGKNLFLSKEST